LLDVARDLVAVVASVPSTRYGEAVINNKLSDLRWVSRAALAHEAVVEHFARAHAVLPMKLFTIFGDDERAGAHLRGEAQRLRAVARKVAGHHEWGVRVLLAPSVRPVATTEENGASGSSRSGAAYLTAKKVRRDASLERSSRARTTTSSLYTRLAKRARASRRRGSDGIAGASGLLLDAAFLVPRSRGAAFRALAMREARALAPQGYAVAVTGPWPPYTFVQD
jgi:hypothetical protein